MNDNPYAAPQAEIQIDVANVSSGKRPLATRWQRFAGNLIDTCVLVVGVIFFAGLLGGLVGFFYPEYFEMAETPFVSIVEYLVILVIMSLFFFGSQRILAFYSRADAR